MSGFHDQSSARSHALPAGGHTSSGAFASPGKRTLTEGLGGARGSGPIQLQGDGSSHPIPSGALVSQYGPGSDWDRKNDCGPSCILMALRAMGLEQRLKDLIPDDFRSVNNREGPINDQTEVEYICVLGFDGDRDSRTRSLAEIQSCLIAVLGALGVSVPEPETMFQLLSPPGQPLYSSTNRQQASAASPQGPAGDFIQQHCTDGSAVMVLGEAAAGPWPWGGMQDPGNTHRVTDQGSHIVLVWRPDQAQDKYTVMDPSWTAPLLDKPLQDIMQFMYARGPGGASVPLNVMAVPYERVAELTSGRAAPRQPGRGPTLMPKRGSAAAAPVEDAGAGAPLPEPTRFKLQDLFGTDLSAVRFHQGGAAPAMGALAYAQGDDVHFAPGRFQPGTPDGDRLIGHEVAHVVQQREGRVAAPQHKGAVVADAALEAEADAFGDRAAQGEVTGGPVRAMQPAGGDRSAAPVQRQGDGGGSPASGGGDDLAGKLQVVADAYRQASPAPTQASGTTPYGQAVFDLWSWCKLNLPPPGDLDTYLHGPVVNDQKRETIGRMAARRGRLEFLLGWLLQGGIHSNGVNWENGPGTNATTGTDGQVTDHTANSGTIVSQYEAGTNNAGDKKIDFGARNQDWCGMFVAFCFGRIGMAETWSGQASDHSVLASAYQANGWISGKLQAVANGGAPAAGEVIISPDMLPVAAVPGAPPPRAAAGPAPQAGDVAVFAHHIAMIESYDPSALRITTIEGNVGLQHTDADGNAEASNSVSGYRYTMQELKDAHGGLRYIWRPSLEAFGATTTGTSSDNAAGDALVQQLDDACDQVTGLYQQLGLPGAPAAGQLVADMAAPRSTVRRPGNGPTPTR